MLDELFVGALILMPLVVLLFPDGRVGPRWQWPLRAYFVAATVRIAGLVCVGCSPGPRTSRTRGRRGTVFASGHPIGYGAWVRRRQARDDSRSS